MADSLRDRIAAVQREHFPSEDGLECDCLVPLPGGDVDDEPFRLHLADAVIAALGLPPTWGVPSFGNGDLTDSEDAK